ncbi:FtsX-like permease family protein [Streptomyces sp. NPDC055722]
MLRLAARTLRYRTGSFLGTFIALLLGAAVVSACGTLLESGLRATVAPQRYAAADVIVAGARQVAVPVETLNGKRRADRKALTERAAIDPALPARIARIEGVQMVITDEGVPVQVWARNAGLVTGSNGAAPTGHNWSSTRLGGLRLVAGRKPTRSEDVALDVTSARRAHIRPGDRISVLSAAGAQTKKVTAVLAQEDGAPLREASVFFPDGHLPAVPSPRTQALGVFAAPHITPSALAGRITAVVKGNPQLAVYTGRARARAEFLDLSVAASALVALAASVGGNAAVVSVFIVYATLALSVSHRRREVALLRAVGTTPRQVRRMIWAETLLTALPAGLLGWPLGVGLVWWMRGQFAQHQIVPTDFTPYIGPLPAAAAVLVTTVSAITAGLAASRRATRIAPTQALGEAAVPHSGLGRGRTITGAVLAVLSAGLFITGLGRSGDFATLVGLANSLILLLVITAAVLGPTLARTALRAIAPLFRLGGVSSYLAAANTQTNTRRLAAAVTPLILAASFASTVVFAQTTGLAQAEQQMKAGLRADRVIASPVGISPAFLQQIKDDPQVETATPVIRSKVVIVGRALGEEKTASLSAQGIDPTHLGQTLDLGVTSGSMTRLSGQNVALSTSAASWLGLHLKDHARLYLGDGTPVTATVTATYQRGMGFADVTLPHDLLRAHTTSALDTTVLVHSRPDPPEGDRRLLRVVQSHPGATMHSRMAMDAQLRQQRTDAWISYLVVAVIIGYIAVAVIATQAMATAARRQEFALLRLTGTQRHQVMRMMRWESLAVILAGLVTGTLLSAFPLMLVARAVGPSWWPTVPAPLYGLIAGSIALLTLVGALLPARLLLRRQPTSATG